MRVTGFPEAIQKAKELRGIKWCFWQPAPIIWQTLRLRFPRTNWLPGAKPAGLFGNLQRKRYPRLSGDCKCGPFSKRKNLIDFSKYPVGVVVSKDSGTAGGTAEKIEAAEE